MGFLGRKQLGEEFPVDLLCTDATGTPGAPDVAPWLVIYDVTLARQAYGTAMAPVDRYRQPGLFRFSLFLSATFGTGNFCCLMAYKIAGQAYAKLHTFEGVAGGQEAGSLVSMWHVERPQGRYLLQKSDGGTRFFGRNPGA